MSLRRGSFTQPLLHKRLKQFFNEMCLQTYDRTVILQFIWLAYFFQEFIYKDLKSFSSEMNCISKSNSPFFTFILSS